MSPKSTKILLTGLPGCGKTTAIMNIIASLECEKVAGGLVGRNGYSYWPGRYPGKISNCYSTSSISGNLHVGGLTGYSYIGDISDSFWDIETSGQTMSYGGEGKATAEMQTAGTFVNAGWDFVDEIVNGTEDTWWILEGQDYPHLWWELTKDILIDSKDML